MEGEVDKSGFKSGTEIIVERDGEVRALGDCVFVRMALSANSKKVKKVREFEHYKAHMLAQIETRLTHDDQKHSLVQKFKEIDIFNQLPKADFNLLADKCQLKNILKGKHSH